MITLYDKYSKYDKLNSIILGYLTRKYKRNIPLNDSCNKCNKRIEGTIHRYENLTIKNNKKIDMIMYKSNIEENNGLSSFCFDKITYSIKENNNIFCYKCYTIPNNNDNNENSNEVNENSNKVNENSNEVNEKCSICLDKITKVIQTNCNHVFCNKCLLKWINTDNKLNVLFNAICPICRNKI